MNLTAGETLFATGAAKLDDSTRPANVLYDSANDNWRHEAQSIFYKTSSVELGPQLPLPIPKLRDVIVSRDDNVDFTYRQVVLNQNFEASITGEDIHSFSALTTTAVTNNRSVKNSSVDWVDELDPAVSIGYDSVNQRLSFQVDRTVLGSGTSADFTSFTAYGSADQTGTNGLGLRNADNAPRSSNSWW